MTTICTNNSHSVFIFYTHIFECEYKRVCLVKSNDFTTIVNLQQSHKVTKIVVNSMLVQQMV